VKNPHNVLGITHFDTLEFALLFPLGTLITFLEFSVLYRLKHHLRKSVSCRTSGFRFGVDDVFVLLDFYAATFVFVYRRFGIAYRSHFQEASIVRFRKFVSDEGL
jgi:hypothetical protein